MKITRYSKNCIKMAVSHAIDNCENREKQLAMDYIKLNPQDEIRRNRDKDLILFGYMSARQEIYKELDRIFSVLDDMEKYK